MNTNIARHAFLSSVARFEAPADQGAIVVTPYDGNAAAKMAREYAAKAEQLGDTLETIFTAKTEMAGGPLRVLAKLQAIYGDDLINLPKPGSETGNNRDAIEIDVTDDSGQTKSVKTTVYTVFSDNTPRGKLIVDRLALCVRAKAPDTVKDGIPEDIMELARTRGIEREIEQLQKKRSNFRASIKKAMELMYQFMAIEEVDDVIAEPIWENEPGGAIIQAIDCIHVYQMQEDGKRPKYSRDYSVSAFLKLDPKKAIEAGGGFKALEATAARGTKGKPSTPAEKLTIKTVETGITVLAEFHRWLDEVVGNRDTTEMAKLLKYVNTNGSDELVSAIVESRNFLNDIVEAAKLQSKYTKLQQKAA